MQTSALFIMQTSLAIYILCFFCWCPPPPPPFPSVESPLHNVSVSFTLMSMSWHVHFTNSSLLVAPFSFAVISFSSIFFFLLCGNTNSEGAWRTHRAPPQGTFTMVPKCTLGCPKHNLTCSPDSHWDALELQPFAQGYPLAFIRALTERRSLIGHFNHLYIIVLWHNGPNVL